MRFKKCLLVLVMAAVFSSCQALAKSLEKAGYDKEAKIIRTGQSAVAAVKPFSIDEEVEIGRAMAARIITAGGGIYPDEELNRYVNLVGRAVAFQVSRSDLPADMYQFAVLNSQDINAFAVPGGYILITLGSLKIIETEAELAGVLAHEIAHIDRGHLINDIKTAHGAEFLSQLTSLLTNNDNSNLNKLLATSSDSGISTLYQKGLSRSAEEEADHYAVKYLINTGYTAGSLVTFLDRLKDKYTRNDSVIQQLKATHPDTDDRIKTIEKYLAEKQIDKNSGKAVSERYRTAIGKL